MFVVEFEIARRGPLDAADPEVALGVNKQFVLSRKDVEEFPSYGLVEQLGVGALGN